jgi:putative tryptophan/tyrosine transport system substrate-binding protein
VSSLTRPGGNVTGMSDLSPIGLHLGLISQIAPETKRLGVIYNPGEANSVTLVELVRKEAPERGLEIVEAPAPRSADVLPAAQSLVGKVDAIYVPTDNTVVPALEAVVKVGTDNQLPVFAGDTDSVPRGAIAALGFNYYDLGRQTGQIVLRVLQGDNPGDIPVEGVRTTELYVNPAAAEAMGVTIPPDMLQRAKFVVD